MMTSLGWPDILEPGERPSLAKMLLAYVRGRRWFRSKARAPRTAEVADLIPLDLDNVLAILRIVYDQGDSDLYAVPLAHIDREQAASLMKPVPHDGDVSSETTGIIAMLGTDKTDGALVDGFMFPDRAAEVFWRIICDGRSAAGSAQGTVVGEFLIPSSAGSLQGLPTARVARGEQTNSTAIFGDKVLLKFYRQLTAGPNPELEVGRFLTAHCQPSCGPRVLGSLTYRTQVDGQSFGLGIAHEFLSNEGDAHSLALDDLRAYFTQEDDPAIHVAPHQMPGLADLLIRARTAADPAPSPGLGRLASLATVLGRRTGELHLAFARAGTNEPDFTPEALAPKERSHLVTRAQTMLTEQLDALSDALPRLTPAARELADDLRTPNARQLVFGLLAAFKQLDIDVVKTRTHGDLHLGQVLVCGDDVVIIDFEGEPARPMVERRAKSSPLRDVMGMVRSFDYAPEVLLRDPQFATADPARRRHCEQRGSVWKTEVTASYLRGYLSTVDQASFLPATPADLLTVLRFYELEKVIYELAYELGNRPDWIAIPLRGLAAIVKQESENEKRRQELQERQARDPRREHQQS